MKRRRQPSRTPWAFWADQWETGLAMAATLAVRVPHLMSGTMTPAETNRMVAEKLAAAGDGLRHGALALSKLTKRKPRRPTLGCAMTDALTIWTASTAPARRTVRANAKRLSSQR